MKYKRIISMCLLILGITFISVRCKREEPTKGDSPRPSSTVSLRATQAFQSLRKGTFRSGELVILSDIDSLPTKKDGVMLYLANFQNEGFLLFREDKYQRMEILGFSNESSFHYADTVQNRGLVEQIIKPALHNFSDSGTSNVLGRLGPNGEFIPDSPWHYPWRPSQSEYPKFVDGSELSHTEFLCKPTVFEFFSQKEPFNEKIADKWPLGCGTVAVATVLSYFEKTPKGIDVEWGILRMIYSYWEPGMEHDLRERDPVLLYNLQEMFRKIRIETNSYSGIDKDGKRYTLSTARANRRGLRTAGLKSKSYDFKNEKLYAHFEKGEKTPLIIRGWETPSSAHYWVIDAAAIQHITKYKIRYDSPEDKGKRVDEHRIKSIFYHCVWGWGGTYNGWYSPYLFYASTQGQNNDIGKGNQLKKTGTPNENNHFKPSLIFEIWE